jgi:hypothetical protein
MLQEVNAAGARLLTLLNYTMLQSKSLIIENRYTLEIYHRLICQHKM